jgi:hypothetical protein
LRFGGLRGSLLRFPGSLLRDLCGVYSSFYGHAGHVSSYRSFVLSLRGSVYYSLAGVQLFYRLSGSLSRYDRFG